VRCSDTATAQRTPTMPGVSTMAELQLVPAARNLCSDVWEAKETSVEVVESEEAHDTCGGVGAEVVEVAPGVVAKNGFGDAL
jgi:hypothetical protein